MSEIYKLARELKKTATAAPYQAGWYLAEIVQSDPIMASIADGAVKIERDGMVMTRTAQAVPWEIGDQAVGILSAGKLLLIDKI